MNMAPNYLSRSRFKNELSTWEPKELFKNDFQWGLSS